MRTYLDCYPCFLRQALDASRRATDDARIHREVVHRVAQTIPTLPDDATPVELGRVVHRIVREMTGIDDPYHEAKRSDNERVMTLLPRLREIVVRSSDRLLTALRLAAAGNAIDLGVAQTIDIESAIEHALEDGGRMDGYAAFADRLARVEEVLYLGDNAGEIVFDRLVVEQLVSAGKRVTFVVRGRPILNDATLDDAEFIGLTELAEIVTSGSDGPGTARALCDPAFLDRFDRAGAILSKGQGNYEGLSEEDAPLFFLLKVKCPVVAAELEEEVGTILLRSQRERGRDR